MTQRTRKQTTEPILGTPILGTNQLQPVEWEGVAYCSSVSILGTCNILNRFVYVDLIWKTIQVIRGAFSIFVPDGFLWIDV